MARIEKQRVKRSFSCHADQYDLLATVQNRVVDRFAGIVTNSGTVPERLLDIGSGTGRLVSILKQKMPSVEMTGLDLAYGMISRAGKSMASTPGIGLVCGDAEALSFRDRSFDLVVSTSTYQWLNPLEPAFAEAWRVLKPGGRFCFALFGEKTLFELRESYNNAVMLLGHKFIDRTHRFLGTAAVTRALESAGFTGIDIIEEIEIENYPDVYSLLRAVNGIGAGNASDPSSAGLGGRGLMLKMMEIYMTRFGDPRGVPATYEVLYGTGTKVA